MESDINLKVEGVYCNMDEKEEKPTKKLLNDPVSTASADPFFFSSICNCLFACCFLLCA